MTVSKPRRKLNITLSFMIFLGLLFLVTTPIQVSLRELALIEDRTIISIGGLEITNIDIITICSLAAGSIALSQFFTEVILPQTRKVRRKR